MIGIQVTGDHKRTRDWITKILRGDLFAELNKFGAQGVAALSSVTPKDTGQSAGSWGYRIVKNRGGPGIEWYNTNRAGGTPVVILLQYGHGTGTGGYVRGQDFINPAIKPIFDQIADNVWKKVKNG